jgi:antitoxin component YwqK of YwqJK toxin-antitoxin module
MITMPGNVEQETITLDDGSKQIISYLDENGEFEEKYDLDAVNMLIQTYDVNGVLIKEELQKNPYSGKYKESEHYEKWLEIVEKVSKEDAKTGLNTL